MGFLSLIPAILGVIDKVLPNTAERDAARLELMRIVEENKYKEFELEVNDRSSARGFFDGTDKSNLTTLATILAWTICIGFILFTAALFIFKVPVDMKDIVIYLAGQLSSAFLMVVSFFFGSSSSSRNKDEALAAALKNHADYTNDKTFHIK